MPKAEDSLQHSTVILFPQAARPQTIDQLVDELTRINVAAEALRCRERSVMAAIDRRLGADAGAAP